jgi:hypothetical protein
MKTKFARLAPSSAQTQGRRTGTGNHMKRCSLVETRSEETAMSDPREFERDPNLSGNRHVGRQSSGSESSAWIIAGVIVVILLGLAAYSYNGGTQVSSSGTPPTTSGQSTRAPAPDTPPAAPAAPTQPRQ